jgi:hypothetical protein
MNFNESLHDAKIKLIEQGNAHIYQFLDISKMNYDAIGDSVIFEFDNAIPKDVLDIMNIVKIVKYGGYIFLVRKK